MATTSGNGCSSGGGGSDGKRDKDPASSESSGTDDFDAQSTSSATSAGKSDKNATFSSQSIGLRAQKKMAGQLANRRAAKFFIDEISSRIFDNVFKMMRMYTGSKSRAHKIMKNIIKINIKLAILYLNDVLDDDELLLSGEFREKFHAIAETCLRIRRPRSRVTVDHLIALFSDSKDIVLKLIARHLSDKSKNKVEESAAFFMNREFLVTIFGDSPDYKDIMDQVVKDIQELLDRGII